MITLAAEKYDRQAAMPASDTHEAMHTSRTMLNKYY
jgi:hypothetical protein